MYNPYYNSNYGNPPWGTFQYGGVYLFLDHHSLKQNKISDVPSARVHSVEWRRIVKEMSSSEFNDLKEKIREEQREVVALPTDRILSNKQFIELVQIVCTTKNHITKLELPACLLTDKSITEQVILLLLKNESLNSINLSYNEFTEFSERIFVSILRTNFSLTHFDFHSDSVNKEHQTLAETYLNRNQEIQRHLRDFPKYFELLKQLRVSLPTGPDLIAFGYFFEITRKETSEFLYDYMIPYLHARVINSRNSDIESFASKLTHLKQLFQGTNEPPIDKLSPGPIIKFHDEKIKKNTTRQVASLSLRESKKAGKFS